MPKIVFCSLFTLFGFNTFAGEAEIAECRNDMMLTARQLQAPVAFDQMQPDSIRPGLVLALRTLEKVVQHVTANVDEPTFKNTVDPILSQLAHFDRLMEWRTFFAKAAKVSIDVSDLLPNRQRLLFRNKGLYRRLITIQDRQGLNPEEKFVVNDLIAQSDLEGVGLPDRDKVKLIALQTQIEQKRDQFRINLEAADSRFFDAPESTPFDPGMPEAVLAAARKLAKDNHKEGYSFSLKPEMLDRSHSFLQYASRDEDRWAFFKAYINRARIEGSDNSRLAVDLANLRLLRARALGKANFADTILPRTMVGSRKRLKKFLATNRPEFLRTVDAEMAQISALESRLTGESVGRTAPWNVQYYAKKLEIETLNFDMAKVTPYLEVNGTTDRLLEMIGQIFGLIFEYDPSIPVWHPDVKVVRVVDRQSHRVLGRIYLDLLARNDKPTDNQALELTPPGSYAVDGGKGRVHLLSDVVINMQVPKGSNGEPAFFNFRLVRSLMHEFGHALHSLSSQASYSLYDSFQVALDFVELPSQLLENWLYEPRFLEKIGHHFETGQPLPEAWVNSLQGERNLLAGLKTLARRGLMTDMDLAWHSIEVPITGSAEDFEKTNQQAWKEHAYLVAIAGMGSVNSYIFQHGYEAQFYSYQWAESHDFDAFESFKANDLFDSHVGMRFRNLILRRGKVMVPAEVYREFRGRDADPTAILRKFGLGA